MPLGMKTAPTPAAAAERVLLIASAVYQEAIGERLRAAYALGGRKDWTHAGSGPWDPGFKSQVPDYSSAMGTRSDSDRRLGL